MGGRITVYVCREQEHEELIKTLQSILDSVKGTKPKLKVIKLKLERAEDFPYFLNTLEELYGGIATAEYRKYGIQSLPAIVYNDRTILQGRVPTREELEEALSYEGLRITRKVSPDQPILQPATIQAAQPRPASERLRIEIPVRNLPPAERPSASAAGGVKPEKTGETVLIPAPAVKPQPKQSPQTKPAAQTQAEPRPLPGPESAIQWPVQPPEGLKKTAVKAPPLEVEELSVEAKPKAPEVSPAYSTSAKSCNSCIFYNKLSNRCLLYRVDIADPSNPICTRRP